MGKRSPYQIPSKPTAEEIEKLQNNSASQDIREEDIDEEEDEEIMEDIEKDLENIQKEVEAMERGENKEELVEITTEKLDDLDGGVRVDKVKKRKSADPLLAKVIDPGDISDADLEVLEMDGKTIQKEALEGNTVAQRYVGLMHLTGEGLRPSTVLARKWFKRAAANGDVASSYYYGAMCIAGDGGPINKDQARTFMLAAAEGGYPDAFGPYGRLLSELVGEHPKFSVKARRFLALACEQGDMDYMLEYVKMLNEGAGGEKDEDEANYWTGIYEEMVLVDKADPKADPKASKADSKASKASKADLKAVSKAAKTVSPPS